MIFLTRLDKQQTYLNPDHIVSIEETPDTVITLFNGHHFIVRESAREIIERIVAYRSRIIRRANAQPGKKYRGKQRTPLYRSLTLNRDDVHSLEPEKRGMTPLHSQDF